MPVIEYVARKFSAGSREMIRQANEIIAEYTAQGFDLTLRQTFYQFVSRDLLANTTLNYKRLGSIINDARLAGLIDWDHISDRTRSTEIPTTWLSPVNIISACARQFRIDKWDSQTWHCEVWIEKEALAGVFERVCTELQIAYLSCRGYTSQSEMWRSGRRLGEHMECGKEILILHFGDHDPSGIDMSRDIKERLEMFAGEGICFKRIALNMPQIRAYNPPANPAKLTDSRSDEYVRLHGNQSWELDALDPTVLAGLVRAEVMAVRNEGLWAEAVEEENEHRRLLTAVSDDWQGLTENL